MEIGGWIVLGIVILGLLGWLFSGSRPRGQAGTMVIATSGMSPGYNPPSASLQPPGATPTYNQLVDCLEEIAAYADRCANRTGEQADRGVTASEIRIILAEVRQQSGPGVRGQ